MEPSSSPQPLWPWDNLLYSTNPHSLHSSCIFHYLGKMSKWEIFYQVSLPCWPKCQIHTSPLTIVEWKKLWSMKFNERLKYRIWKIVWDVLPAREFLAQRIAGLNSSCPQCHHPQKSVVHVLFECPFAIIVWRHTNIPINLSSIPPKSTSE